MRRPFPSIGLAAEPLDPHAGAPLHRQLYFALRDAIVSGKAPAGAALPSTRSLARSMKLARNTVVTAFDQLVAEGYVESRVGAGTFVAHNVLGRASSARDGTGARGEGAPRRALSQRGALLSSQQIRPIPGGNVVRPFRSGTPALDMFPYGLWARLTAHCTRHAPRALLAYSDPAGYRPLREAIASYLATSRAIRCSPEQVIVTVGSQQALDLTARLVLDPGDPVWIEEPGYRGARAALAGNGATLIPVPLDREGLDVDLGRAREPNPRLVYITPSCQYPMTTTMSLGRRLALLDFARRNGAWIFEDDYDGEFRYVGRPIAALAGLDDGARVIYAGTLSKVLFPGLRLGYVVAPPDLVDAFVAARAVADRNAPGIEQAVVTHFMGGGHFARHLRLMRELYKERQDALVAAAKRHLGGELTVGPHDTGMHVIGLLPAGRNDVTEANAAFRNGVDVVPLSTAFLGRATHQGFIMCYTSAPPPALRDGVRRLAKTLERS